MESRRDKICFIGSHGTGKSRLVHELLALYIKHNRKPVRAIAELATQVQDEGMPLNHMTDLETQMRIVWLQHERESFYTQKGFNMVCDRNDLDNFVYLETRYGRSDDPAIRDRIDYMRNVVLGWVRLFPPTRLYFVPVTLVSAEETDSSTGLAFQLEIDKNIRKFLEEENVAPFYLPEGERHLWLSYIERDLFGENRFTEPLTMDQLHYFNSQRGKSSRRPFTSADLEDPLPVPAGQN